MGYLSRYCSHYLIKSNVLGKFKFMFKRAYDNINLNILMLLSYLAIIIQEHKKLTIAHTNSKSSNQNSNNISILSPLHQVISAEFSTELSNIQRHKMVYKRIVCSHWDAYLRLRILLCCDKSVTI